MSRAFMKERDDLAEPALVVERQGPVPMTPAGFAALRSQLDAASTDAERVRLGRLLDAAEVIEPPPDREVEADPAAGRIGVSSPLAEALLGHRAGDSVVWHRPAGDRTLAIRRVAY